MILTCPQCSTRYHVDAKSIGAAGRTVRCASCGNRWLATPPADAPRVVEFDQTLPPANPQLLPVTGSAAGPGAGSASLVGWLIGVLVILIVASAVIGRNEIVAGFPASATIYQKLGLPITLDLGLQFEGVVSRRIVEQGGIAVLVVEGAVVNVTDQQRPVPPIRVTLLDGGGRRLQQELFEAADTQLDGGGKTTFSGRLVNPAEQARNFSVTFDVDS